MARIKKAAKANYPKGLTTGAFQSYQADAVGGIAVGAAVNVWPDGSGNGRDLSVLGVNGTAPTLRQDTDLLPYVAFDGVNNLLGRIDPSYVGTELTMYLVARSFLLLCGTGNRMIVTLTRTLQNAGVAAGTFRFGQDPAQRYVLALRDNVAIQARAEPSSVNSQWAGQWRMHAVRFAIVSGDVAYWHAHDTGAWGGDQFGAPGTPLSAFNYDRFAIGGQMGFVTDVPPQVNNDNPRVDVRALALYRSAHSDLQMKNNLRFLAHKWNVPVLD